jgi:Protein of unknown function DUF262
LAKEWDIKRTTFSVGDFLSWQRSSSLQLSPSFQRRNVWTKPQKSFLVDTVYRGLPVPIIFLRERTDVESLSTIREVIDGQQRLRTLISFVDLASLKDGTDRDVFLVQKKHNPDIADRAFSKLSAAEKTRILSYQFSVHVLPSDTSDADVLSIFARMNSTGSKLNEQELRNAEFFGPFKILSYETAFSQLERWRRWGVFSEQDIARMKEVEFTSELFILLLDGMIEQTQATTRRYYKKFDDSFPMQDSILAAFRKVMQSIEDHFGDSIATSNFSSRAQFFQLFWLLHRLELARIDLSRARVRLILDIGDRIRNRKNLPDDVSLALVGRFNRVSNRLKVADFLFKHASV